MVELGQVRRAEKRTEMVDAEGKRAAVAAEGEQKWLYEHVVERVPGLSRLPARTSVLIQLLIMEALGLALGKAFAVEPMALARGSLLIIAVAASSELLLVVAPRLRLIKVMTGAEEPEATGEEMGGILGAYGRWVFHPWHLEAAPGALMFVGAWMMLLPVRQEGASVLEQMLGRSPTPLLLLPVVLLSWDVCYRLGVGLWVAMLSAWRSLALCRMAKDAGGPGQAFRVLRLKWLRRMDRRMLLFPLTSGLVLLPLVPWAVPFYHLVGVAAVTAGLGMVALVLDGACIRAMGWRARREQREGVRGAWTE